MRVDFIDKAEVLHEIESCWVDLLSDSKVEDVFLLPQWFFSWWNVFGKGKGLFFVALWEGKKLIGLFPLCRVKKGPFWVITFPGRPADRMDFLLAKNHEEECIKVFSEWILSRADWDLLSLRNFGCFSNNPEIFDHILGKIGRRRILLTDVPCFFISAGDHKGFHDYLKTVRSARSRKALRRKKKRAMKYNSAEWKVLNRIGPGLLDDMEELDLKRSTRGLNRASFFNNPLNKRFLEEISKRIQHDDIIRVFTFRVGGRLCAYELDFKFHKKLLSYQGNFDRALHKDSVGIHTQLEAIKYVFENKYHEYDLLTGAEVYKSDWAPNFRQCRRLMVYGGGNRSFLLYLYHKKIKPIRRRMKDHLLIKKILPKNLKFWDI